MHNIFGYSFAMDSRTLLIVLFTGNLMSAILIAVYHRIYLRDIKEKVSSTYATAKILEAVAFLLLLFRGSIFDFLSVTVGNVCLMTGHYFEAIALQKIGNISSEKNTRFLRALLAIFVTLFVAVEYLYHNPALRIVYASIGVFGLLLVPILQFIFSRNTNTLKKAMGLFYLLVLIFLLPRIIYSLFTPETGLFANAFFHVMTFLTLTVLLLYGQSFYLLMAKEKSDDLLKRRATTDSLSGLLNRASFTEMATRELKSSILRGSGVAVFFCDIDHFKKINDLYGHRFGDEVIKKCSEIFQSLVRKNDLVCRYGGEEFAIFATVSDAGIAEIMANRILEKIRSVRFPEHPDFCFTISIGVISKIPGADEALEEYIQKSDEALYLAKNSGRNQYRRI